MSRIEEIFFEAFELGIQDKLYSAVSKIIHSEEFKHKELNVIYEEVLKREKEVLYNNNLYESTNNSEVHQ